MQTDGREKSSSVLPSCELTGKATITTSLARYVHGLDSGMNIIGLTNHFLISQVEMCNSYCKSCQEPRAGELIGPRGERITAILLNGHNIKLSSAS